MNESAIENCVKLCMDINIEKFRWSLIGDGYLKEEVKLLTTNELMEILKARITSHIEKEYNKSKRYGLVD